MSCQYTPEQNGLAERKHIHILETTITLLQTANLPSKFWFHACATSIYLINRMPCPILQLRSPYLLLNGSIPVLTHLKILAVHVFLYSSLTTLTNFNLKLPPAFYWDMQVNTGGISVFLSLLISSL